MSVGLNINLNKCHGCGACVIQCTNKVLSLRILTTKEINQLGFFGKFLAKHHPNKAYVQDCQKCTTCGLCETVCKYNALHIKENC